MNDRKRSIGTLIILASIFACVLGFPQQINDALHLTPLLPSGEKLNGPNDITLLIRLVLGLGGGIAVAIGLWSLMSAISGRSSTPGE